jgi:hypothetical protein
VLSARKCEKSGRKVSDEKVSTRKHHNKASRRKCRVKNFPCRSETEKPENCLAKSRRVEKEVSNPKSSQN